MADIADIKALGRGGLTKLMDEVGEPRWRAGQLVRWLYGRRASSFDDMTDLPLPLRQELADRFIISSPQIVTREVSKDGTRKYLLRMQDGVEVETVAMPSGIRLTVCFSTQAGCAMGCAFCATGRGGFVRDLSAGEMVDQVLTVAGDIGRRASNAVAMGQGEPFANYAATLDALRLLNDGDGPGIGARRITVSTCGLPDRIEAFADEPEQFTLAVSLHSAVQPTRDRLMPGVRGAPLTALRAAIATYVATGRRPTVEYALIAGVNDTVEEIGALVGFCRDLGVHVNLIPVNPVGAPGVERSPEGSVRQVEHALRSAGIEVSVRVERGADIAAACGQLRQRAADAAAGQVPPGAGQSPQAFSS